MPSYAYAHMLHEQLRHDYPSLRCDLQPRDLAAAEQVPFLESGLLLADALLLILGSRFSEGIDLLGGRVSHAIVVSPALPEVNARQRAREQLAKASPDPFAEIYIHPGMRKVIQAVGRMVREPSHSVSVLLHCQRFASPAYQRLLPEHLQPKAHLFCDEDFELHWLRDVAME
jgi:Rad3-related DNA helicase